MLAEAIRLLEQANNYSIRLQMGEDWCVSVDAVLAAHSDGAQEPVAWAVYNGWCKIAFYMSEEGARDHVAAAQRSHDLSGSLAAFRAVPLYTHPQPMPQTDAARDAIELLRKFMEYRDSDYVPNVLFDRARTVIDRAKGE